MLSASPNYSMKVLREQQSNQELLKTLTCTCFVLYSFQKFLKSSSLIFFIMSSVLRTSFFLITFSSLCCCKVSRDTFSGRSSESTCIDGKICSVICHQLISYRNYTRNRQAQEKHSDANLCSML